MISHKHKFIFIHIPKTGGTSIEACFLNPKTLSGSKHLGIADYPPNDYFKFTVVRNPWEQAVSWVKFRDKRYKRTKGTFRERFKQDLNGTFVLRRSFHNMCTIDGKDVMDYIIRFENLEEGFKYVCKQIGLPGIKLPHRNKSKHGHYREYYDDEMRDTIAIRYREDIEKFGYEF